MIKFYINLCHLSGFISGKINKLFLGILLFIFSSLQIKAQGPAISYTSLSSVCIDGNRNLTATITDADGVPTAGAGLPVLYWSYNSLPFSPVTAVSLGSNQYQFTFGAGAFSGSIISYYIVAQDNTGLASNISVSPSSGASGFSANPPKVTIPPTNPEFYAVNQILSGTYLVGVGQYYNTITDAISAYNSACLGGPVTFVLTDVSYGTSESFPINIFNPQASATNTLTIKPNLAINTIITGSNADALFKLNGADYVFIDGSNSGTTTRNLTLQSTSTSLTSSVVWLASANASNGCNGNVIRNCNIYGNTASTTFSGIAMSNGVIINNSADTSNNNNSFINNNINSAYYGIYINGSIVGETGNIISKNIIGSSVLTKKIGFRSINLINQNSFTISSNQVAGNNSIYTSTSELDASGGVFISGVCSGGNINNNLIYDIKNSSTFVSATYGISLQTNSNFSNINVYNNFIHSITSRGSINTISENGLGISIISGGGYNIYFNSIQLGINQSTAGISSCIYVGANVQGTINVNNNILSNRETSGNRFSVYSLMPPTVFSSINNNDYFSSDKIGYISLPISTLVAWQAATLNDGNSTVVDPIFVIANNANLALIDLHLQLSSPLNNQAVPIAGITTDFDGTTRSSTTPDIGAHEISPPNCSDNFGGTISTNSSLILCVSGQIVMSSSGFSYGTGISYQWQYSTDNTTWNSIVGETNPSSCNPPVINVPTFYRLKVVCLAGVAGYSNVLQIVIKNPGLTSFVGASRCGTGSLVLTANGNPETSAINWYSTLSGGQSLSLGTSYTTPVLNASTTYYAEPSYVGGSGVSGPLNPVSEGGTIALGTTPWNMYFDVFNATTLSSVDIFPNNTGESFNINVYNSNNQLLGTAPVITNVSGGATAQTIPLNFFLQPGTGYYLLIDAGTLGVIGTGLTRNTTNASYPYVSTDISITGNNFNSSWYFFLYNWKYFTGCSVGRTAVTAVINSSADILINATSTNICNGTSTTLTASSTNSSYVYSWTPIGLTGASITVSPTSNITYTVVGNAGACSNTKSIDIVVSAAPTPITINPVSAALCSSAVATLTTTGGSVSSSTILDEKFEGPEIIPPGWDTLVSAVNSWGKWKKKKSIYIYSSPSVFPTAFKSNDSSKFFIANSDSIAIGNAVTALNTSLRTPKLDFTGYSNATLSFWQHYYPFIAPDSINIEMSKNPSLSATTWKSIYRTGPSTSGYVAPATGAASSNPIGTPTGFVQKIIDLTPFLTTTAGYRDTFYIRFRYRAGTTGFVSNGTGFGCFYWAIDNVLITGSGGAPIVWTPATGLYSNLAATIPYVAGTQTTIVYAKPAANTTYTATSGSPNGCSAFNTVPVTLKPVVSAVVSGTTTTCSGSSATVSVALTGVAPWKLTYTNGVTPVNITGITTSPYTFNVTPTATTTYTVTSVTDANVCTAAAGSITGSAVITVSSVSAVISGNSNICSGSNANISITMTGSSPWSITYTNGVTPTTVSGITASPYNLIVSPSTTTTYTLSAMSTGGCTAPLANLTGSAVVTVAESSTAIISGSANICSGSSTNISVAFTGPSPWSLTYTNGTTPVTVNGITTSPYLFSVSPIVNTSYSITSLTNGAGCIAVPSSYAGTANVVVSPQSVGGSVSGGTTVCTGTNSTTLTVSGFVGDITSWLSSLDNFATAGTTISNNTASLVVTNLTTTTYYKAIITSGVCSSSSSSVATIAVSPLSLGGSISGGTTVCAGTNNTVLSLSGNIGSPIRWESSSDNFVTAGNPITNTTNTLTIVNLSATTYYRAVVASGVCTSSYSSISTITVGASITGVLTGTATICENGSTNLSVSLTGTTPWSLTYTANGANPVNVTNINSSPYSFPVSPLTNTTYALTSLSDGLGCTASSGNLSSNAIVTVTTASTTTWTGISSNWFDTNNWCGGVPSILKDVLIPSGTSNPPVISGANALAKNITINTGAVLTVNIDGKISISGNTLNNGTIINNGVFQLNGTIDQSFPGGATGLITKMNILEINKTSGITTFDKKFAITDTGVLRITQATTININDTITLKSGATGTSRIDSISSTAVLNYSASGAFTVERYIASGVSHGKSWQLLSTPTFGQNIKQAWQESAASVSSNPYPGFGTTITSNNAGATTTLGFDFFTPSGPTMKRYDVTTNTYIGVPSTNATPIANPNGYMFFVRGDRSIITSAAAAIPVTLRSTGKIFYGSELDSAVSVDVPALNFQSVGNPYASPIDFLNMLNYSTGLSPTYYLWDPSLQGSSGLGAFQTISSFNQWKPIPGGTAFYDATTAYSRIQSGQAFFIYSASGGKIRFAEKNKVSGQKQVLRNNDISELKTLRLYLKDATKSVVDGNVLAVDSNSLNTIDENDALKLNNFGENTGIKNGGKVFALDARNSLNADDTVQYYISNLNQPNYKLVFVPSQLQSLNLMAYLVDRYTNQQIPVSLYDTTSVDVTIHSNIPRSRQNDRFYIIFKKLNPLPVTFIDVRAKRVGENIMVDWDVAGELNVSKYEIEKSLDGNLFEKTGIESSVNNDGRNHTYHFTDLKPFSGFNFYRIKSIDISGAYKFSNVVKVWYESSIPDISVIPNPIEGNVISMTFKNQPAGIYQLELYNSAGQLMANRSISHNGAVKTAYLLKPGKLLVSGNYTLKALLPNNAQEALKITVN